MVADMAWFDIAGRTAHVHAGPKVSTTSRSGTRHSVPASARRWPSGSQHRHLHHAVPCTQPIQGAVEYRDVVSLSVHCRLRDRQARRRSAALSGKRRMRLPVAAKIALSTAGAATAIVGSPMPPQKPPEGMMITSTFGISEISIDG